MMEAQEYDLVVLGGGTGGYTAAIRASQLGLRVALVEQEKVGGVCLHKGCIPTKALLEAAEVLARVRDAPRFGVRVADEGLDFGRLHERKGQAVEALYQNLQRLLQKHRIETIQGRGRLVSPRQVAVEGPGQRRLRARFVVLATGSRPRELPGLPFDGRRVLSSDHLLTMESPPESLAIVGAGAVGLEFASFFLDIGVPVTVIELLPRLLPSEDEELGRGLERLLTARGAAVLTSARLLPEKCQVLDERVELTVEHGGEEKTVQASHVLVAIGRRGNVEDLGLEGTRVRVQDGFVRVDGQMQTDEPGVYAVGDLVGGPMLAHKAAAEGAIAAEALAGRSPQLLDYARVPRVVYTRPHAAAVGLTEEEARRNGRPVRAQRFSFRNNAMALLRDEAEGVAKVVVDAETGDLLGVHLLGPQAGELVGEAALALYLQASAWELGTSVHPHPSLSEALMDAAQLAARVSIYL
jgi:dihydrolipoamide dehydrogenase